MKVTAAAALGAQSPLHEGTRAKALAFVDEQLMTQGLIEKACGCVSQKAKTEIRYECKTSIPTAGVIVKTCVDECSACEPQLEKKIVQHLDLKNKFLAKRLSYWRSLKNIAVARKGQRRRVVTKGLNGASDGALHRGRTRSTFAVYYEY